MLHNRKFELDHISWRFSPYLAIKNGKIYFLTIKINVLLKLVLEEYFFNILTADAVSGTHGGYTYTIN